MGAWFRLIFWSVLVSLGLGLAREVGLGLRVASEIAALICLTLFFEFFVFLVEAMNCLSHKI